VFSIKSTHRLVLALVVGSIARLATAADVSVSEEELLLGDNRMEDLQYKVELDEAGKPLRLGAIRRVYVIGPVDAPPVILLHELPGLRDGDIDLGVRLGRTFRVWVPLLFGVPNQGNTGTSPGKEQACDSGLFECHSTRASHPILDDLRTLVKRVCTAKDCAIIGMCLTGSFPLSLIHDGRVVALVLAQPSLPFPRWWKPFTFFRRGIDISETQTAAAMKVASEKQASVFMIPFHGDPLSSHRSFRELQQRIRPTTNISLTCQEEHGHFLDHSSLIHDKDHPEESDQRLQTLTAFLDGRLRLPPPPKPGSC